MKKFVAVVMMALTFLAPVTNAAYAAPKGGPGHAPSHKVSRQMPAPKRHVEPKHAPAHRGPVYHAPSRHHDAAAAVIGGLILGTILGAAMAESN